MSSPLVQKFESMSLRERAMISLAILAGVIFLWDALFMRPLGDQRMMLESELASASAAGFVASSTDLSDRRQVNLQRAADLQTQSQALDARLKNSATGFVSAETMVQVLNDVLDRQGRLELVSIRAMPVISLVPPKAADPNTGAPAEPVTTGPGPPPYVHPIELVIDGQYTDIVAYLEALEKLPYRFRWSSLELRAAGYPRNRVRVVLSTVSLDANWLGV